MDYFKLDASAGRIGSAIGSRLVCGANIADDSQHEGQLPDVSFETGSEFNLNFFDQHADDTQGGLSDAGSIESADTSLCASPTPPPLVLARQLPPPPPPPPTTTSSELQTTPSPLETFIDDYSDEDGKQINSVLNLKGNLRNEQYGGHENNNNVVSTECNSSDVHHAAVNKSNHIKTGKRYTRACVIFKYKKPKLQNLSIIFLMS